MKAVILKEPYKIAVEEVAVPKLQTDRDVILKVHQAGLCGKPFLSAQDPMTLHAKT